MEETQPRTKILKNGAVYDLDKGRIVANPGGGKSAITPERSKELRELRAAKAARLLREAIVTETMDALDVPKHGAAESVAAAGGILWREIVLNPEAYARDRIAAYEKLSERAEMTSEHKRLGDEKTPSSDLAGAVNELTAILRAAMQPRDAVDAPADDLPALDAGATDIRNEDG